ncbi:MAG TPA: CoA transferase [Ktedonobacterales bacterium]
MSSPLDGLRVVDLSRALSGPLCAMLLGDLGADVIKVEEPGTGDDSRHWGPPFQNGESAYFLSCNRNKRSITLNLKRDAAREALWRLIERGDILIENFRPGLMASFGFSYEAVHTRNPRLIYCSISAYGQDGPEAARPGYDIIMQGTTGATSVTGNPQGDPYRSGLPVCDVISGLMASQSILAALLARERTGVGQRVEATLLGSTVAALGNFASSYLVSGVAPRRVGNSHSQIAPYDLLRAQDGYINIAGGNDDIFHRLCAALDLPALVDDPRYQTNAGRVTNRPALLATLESRTTTMTVASLVDRLDAAKVPAGPIRDMGEVLESPQALHAGLVQKMEHPTTGVVRVVDTPLRLDETPATLRLAPPTLGEHTAEILDELGYDDATIAAWRESGVAV